MAYRKTSIDKEQERQRYSLTSDQLLTLEPLVAAARDVRGTPALRGVRLNCERRAPRQAGGRPALYGTAHCRSNAAAA